MNKPSRHLSLLIGIVLTFLIFFIHFLIIDDYGLTWDFHHHFFAGLHLLNHPVTQELTNYLPFTDPDPRGTYKLPFGPLMSTAPVATYILLFEKLKLLAFDNAYNISIIATGVGGIFILFLFLRDATTFPVAITASIFLALLPRYWGDLHNNMKDIPQAAAFTLAIWLFWRLVQNQRTKDLILASVSFALAFNTKVNTIAVPLVAALWLGWLALGTTKKQAFRLSKIIYWYFLVAPLFALLLWSFFWHDPIKQLLYIPNFFRDNTQNIEVLLFGSWYCSGVNVPGFYPLFYLAITTPLPILISFIIGIMVCIKTIRRNPLSSLLLLWFFVPILRYLYPKMGAIDGIRHFKEVVFPLAAIAATGFVTACKRCSHIAKKKGIALICLIMLGSLMGNIIAYHPYQITYFNELVGGIRGAYTKFDLDYWGTSQKQAVRWLNAHAPQDSKIHVVMAADVAGKYLRPDLQKNLNTTSYAGADYVVVLNRQSFFYRYYFIIDYMLTHKTVYTVENQNVPLTWIFDNSLGTKPRQAPWWQGEDPCILKYW